VVKKQELNVGIKIAIAAGIVVGILLQLVSPTAAVDLNHRNRRRSLPETFCRKTKKPRIKTLSTSNSREYLSRSLAGH